VLKVIKMQVEQSLPVSWKACGQPHMIFLRVEPGQCRAEESCRTQTSVGAWPFLLKEVDPDSAGAPTLNHHLNERGRNSLQTLIWSGVSFVSSVSRPRLCIFAEYYFYLLLYSLKLVSAQKCWLDSKKRCLQLRL